MTCRRLYTLFVIAAVLLSGCKNEGPDPVVLFTLTIPQGFNSEGIHTVVISDKVGQILVRQVIVGGIDNEFVGLPITEPFNITIIGPIIEAEITGKIQNIETYLEVFPGTHWDLELFDSIPRIGTTEFSFLNVIQNEHILVGTNLEVLPESITNQVKEGETYSLNLIKNNQEVYVKVKPQGEDQHQFIFFEASISENQIVDLNMLQNTMQKEIQIPFSFISSTFDLKNLSRSDLSNSLTLDFSIAPWESNILTFNFPPDRYAEFISKVSAITSGYVFTEITYGPIQENMIKLDVDLNVISNDLLNFNVETAGSYDYFSSAFNLPSNSENNQMNWRVFSEQSNSIEFVMPDFSFCAPCDFLVPVTDLQYKCILVSEFILLNSEFLYENYFQYTQTGYLNEALMASLKIQKER